MNFSDFEHIVSEDRMSRYYLACNGNKAKALLLYRNNVRIALAMFAVVGAFEIALRNSIDRIMTRYYGQNWLRDSILPGGMFDNPKCRDHARIWKYMFSSPQFKASGRVLLQVFPNKPISTREIQYNNTFIFNELDHVNSLRNRIAHHEPICFHTGFTTITTSYIEFIHNKICTLFYWLGIDYRDYLFGLDHIDNICRNISKIALTIQC